MAAGLAYRRGTRRKTGNARVGHVLDAEMGLALEWLENELGKREDVARKRGENVRNQS